MHLHWNDASSKTLDPQPIEEALAALGLQPGHRIALLAGNTPLAILMHAAAYRRGWTLVPLRAQDPPETIERQAKGCDAWVCTKRNRSLAVGLHGAAPLLSCESWGKPDRSDSGQLQTAPPGPGPAFMVQTSGTSGDPQSVPIAWPMLDAHAKAATRRIGDGSDAVWAGVLGLDRIGGIAMVHRSLRHANTLHLEERFDAGRLATVLRHRGVTHVSLVPTMLRRLLAAWPEPRPPPSLRCVLLGGDRAPEDLVQHALARGWPVWCTYGLTEACSQVATARPDERRAKPGTSGRLLDGVRVDIRDGEIVVSGPTVAGGGPLPTGDLGHIDSDGFLFVHGRRDDRITTGGVKVDPVTVEGALGTHPDVADACVVGVPDPEWGQRVVAAVVLREGVAGMPDLKAWCATRLPGSHVPKSFEAVPSLPRTDSGKLQRPMVRATLQATVPT